eukprot:5365636-Ditylum_brightwellii.AAC.1
MKDKNDRSQQSCYSASGEHSQCYNKEELNIIIGKSVKAAPKKECHDHAWDKEHNVIVDLNALSLSSINGNGVSCT